MLRHLTNRRFPRSDAWTIGLLYLMAHGLMLLNKGYYWDDWTFYNINAADAMREFVDNGNRWFGYYLHLLFVAEPFINPRAFTFLAYLLAAILLHRTLLTVPEMTRQARFFVVLFFAVFPVNFARIEIVPCAAYAASYFLFFLGLFLAARFEDKPRLSTRGLCHLCFLGSFFTNSLLVFYALVLLYLGYRNIRSLTGERRVEALRKFLASRLDFLLSPVVFWGMKRRFFMAQGPFYEGRYNVISIKETLIAPLRVFQSFLTSFVEPIQSSALALSPVLLIILAFVLYFWIHSEHSSDETTDSHDRAFLLLGGLAFALGVFPYVVVGKLPLLSDWDSRHQMLVPLGAALMLYYGVSIATRTLKMSDPATRYLLSLLAVAFVARSADVDVSYQQDWFKQMSIVENIRSQKVFRERTTFVFRDDVTKWNTLDRKYRFYEYSGLLRYALGDEKHCGFAQAEVGIVKRMYPILKSHGMLPRYNLSDYSLEPPSKRVLVSEGALRMDFINLWRLIVLEHFRSGEFRRLVLGLISLKVSPV